jgi:hypothetical protein
MIARGSTTYTVFRTVTDPPLSIVQCRDLQMARLGGRFDRPPSFVRPVPKPLLFSRALRVPEPPFPDETVAAQRQKVDQRAPVYHSAELASALETIIDQGLVPKLPCDIRVKTAVQRSILQQDNTARKRPPDVPERFLRRIYLSAPEPPPLPPRSPPPPKQSEPLGAKKPENPWAMPFSLQLWEWLQLLSTQQVPLVSSEQAESFSSQQPESFSSQQADQEQETDGQPT